MNTLDISHSEMHNFTVTAINIPQSEIDPFFTVDTLDVSHSRMNFLQWLN